MCILCEPKYVKDPILGEEVVLVANKIIYHDDRVGPGKDPWEVTNEPAYEDQWGGYYIEHGNELRAIADDPHCSTGPLTINYCPLCGKKLEHKE